MTEERAPQGPEEEEVGYARPPRHTRFPKGRSGNPRGRPRGTRNLKTDLMEELGERILVREGERARKISKQRAVVKTIMTRTLKGDARAAGLLLSLMTRLDPGEGAGEPAPELKTDELEILETFKQRLQRRDSNPPAPDTEEEAS